MDEEFERRRFHRRLFFGVMILVLAFALIWLAVRS